MRRNEGSLKKQSEALGFFQGLKSCNHKELSSANQLSEAEIVSSPRDSRKEQSPGLLTYGAAR